MYQKKTTFDIINCLNKYVYEDVDMDNIIKIIKNINDDFFLIGNPRIINFEFLNILTSKNVTGRFIIHEKYLVPLLKKNNFIKFFDCISFIDICAIIFDKKIIVFERFKLCANIFSKNDEELEQLLIKAWNEASDYIKLENVKTESLEIIERAYKIDQILEKNVDHKIIQYAKKTCKSIYIINLGQIKKNYWEFKKCFPNIKVFYSIKSNPDKNVLNTLAKEGCNFEAVRYYEVESAAKTGVEIDRIIYSNPVKPIEDIIKSYKLGIRIFVVDSIIEIDKLKKYAPDAKVLVRIKTKEIGAKVNLSNKYGTNIENIPKYMKYVKDSNLIPYGLTFQVGGQNENLNAWNNQLTKCYNIIESLKICCEIDIKMINIGGGFPIKLNSNVPSLAKISSTLQLQENIEYIAEPGRFIVGSAGMLICPVISKNKKGNKTWLFIDASSFGSLFMVGIYKFFFPISTDKVNVDYEEYTIASISCDGKDIIYESIVLQEGIDINNVLIFHMLGAYSLPVFDCKYGGVEKTEIHYVN